MRGDKKLTETASQWSTVVSQSAWRHASVITAQALSCLIPQRVLVRSTFVSSLLSGN